MNASTVPTDLESLRLPELWKLFAQVVGEESRCPNKTFLIRKIREAVAPPEPEAVEVEEPPTEEPTELEVESVTDIDPESWALTPTEIEVLGESAEPEPFEVEDDPEPEQHDEAPQPANVAEEENEAPEEEVVPLQPVKLTDLTVVQLRAEYRKVVGRPTTSHHRRYLIWKIGQAKKGKVPVGPTQRSTKAIPHKVLPIRMPETSVKALDKVWRRHGLKSRMDLFRQALDHYLTYLGEGEAAGLFRADEAQAQGA